MKVNKNLILWSSRLFFTATFFVLSLGFVAWEIWGLIKWTNKASDFVVKSRAASYEKGVNLPDNLLVGDKAEEAVQKSEEIIVAADARPLIIKKYLEKYKSPLVPYSDLIFELSQTYGYDYRWIVAIAQQESNLCKKIPEGSHNCWGYGIHKNGTLRFENYELALKSYAEYLKRVYFDKGLDTPELIMKKYCPSSNGSWAYGVTKFMNDMENLE